MAQGVAGTGTDQYTDPALSHTWNGLQIPGIVAEGNVAGAVALSAAANVNNLTVGSILHTMTATADITALTITGGVEGQTLMAVIYGANTINVTVAGVGGTPPATVCTGDNTAPLVYHFERYAGGWGFAQ